MVSIEINNAFEQTELLLPEPTESLDMLGDLSYAITNDILYCILHDLILETHREAKMERAASAAVIVKQKAMKDNPGLVEETSTGNLHSKIEYRAAGALYKDGVVYLMENPLKATSEIICPKCGLPRLLHPTTGRGARAPDPRVEYCKKMPFIDKEYYDVHGQTFVPKGPGRGKRREDMIDPVLQELRASMSNGTQDSGITSQIPTQLKEPHAKCINCGSFQAASRMNKHMSKCIGGLSRESARNAKTKIINGIDTASQNGQTPPGSRNSTPSHGGVHSKSSPSKRSAEDELDESDEAAPKKKKKLIKRTLISKPKTLNNKKNGSQMLASNLSFENKVTDTEYDEGDGDDTRDSNYGTKLTKHKANKVPIKMEMSKPKPKILKKLVKTKKIKNSENSSIEARNSKATSLESRNGSTHRHKSGGTPPTEESSQTMSSPNAV